MLKSLKTILKQDKEKYKIPRSVRDVIPIECIWKDGILRLETDIQKHSVLMILTTW